MDIEKVNESTLILIGMGERIFQAHRFAENDVDHVGKLLEWAEFPKDSFVIDLGCGVGEVSKIMHDLRPDLKFTLVNISEAQLELCVLDENKVLCSFLEVPSEDGKFDAAMFCFSIGHEDILSGLKEAYRLLKDGGVLFIYDMVRVSGSNDSMKNVEYKVIPEDAFSDLIFDAGFKWWSCSLPEEYGSYGKNLLGDEYDKVFNGTKPVIWRIVK